MSTYPIISQLFVRPWSLLYWQKPMILVTHGTSIINLKFETDKFSPSIKELVQGRYSLKRCSGDITCKAPKPSHFANGREWQTACRIMVSLREGRRHTNRPTFLNGKTRVLEVSASSSTISNYSKYFEKYLIMKICSCLQKRNKAQLTRLKRQLQEANSRNRRWNDEACRLEQSIAELKSQGEK